MLAATADYSETADVVATELKKEFGVNSTIVTAPIQGDKVEVAVVSADLNSLSPRERQDRIWGIIRAALGDRASQVAVVLTYGTDELL